MLRIEGFETPLRNNKTLIIGSPSNWIKNISSLESSCLYKGRSILVIQENGKPFNLGGLLARKRWDVIFRIKEQFEIQMLATYVVNAPKPLRILWVSSVGCEIPKTLWSKWASSDVTLIGGQEGTQIGCEWDTILFPLLCPQDFIEKTLRSRASGAVGLLEKIKDHISEVYREGAGLAWTIIEEPASGCIYWHDPSAEQGEEYTKKEVSEILESVSKWLLI